MTDRGVAYRTWFAALAYLVVAVAMLFPQSVHVWDSVWYAGDPLDTVYFLAWNAHQLVTDPLHLFDANVSFPHHGAVLFDAHRLLPALLAAPAFWATGNAIFAYNLALLAVYVFTALAGRQLARMLGLGPLASWTTGVLYSFHTYQINESPRINTIFHGFMPLALAELITYFKTGQRRHAWRVAGLMLLQGLACNYNLIYGAFLLALLALAAAMARPRLCGRRAVGLVVPALTATVLFSPLVFAYLRSAELYGYARTAAPSGIDLQHYLTTPTLGRFNLMYGSIGTAARIGERGPHFVGFVSLGLAVLAFLAWARRPLSDQRPEALLPVRVWVPGAAVLAVLLVVLSLGSDIRVFGHALGPGPYRLLHAYVPGFQFLRFPERLSLHAMLFIALLAGRGLDLIPRPRFSRLAWLLAILIPVEHLAPLGALERLPVGRRVPDVYRWLAKQAVGGIAEVPIYGSHLVRLETRDEYFSTYHFKPIIHGWLTFEPLLSVVLRGAASRFPSETAVAVLGRAGVDTVVVHAGRLGAGGVARALPDAEAAGRIERLARFEAPGAVVFEGRVDEVYRIHSDRTLTAAPFPAGVRRRDPRWHYRASGGDPDNVEDGDLRTSWSVPGELTGEEFLQVSFGREPIRVTGVVLPMVRWSRFPSSFRIRGRTPDGGWIDLARLDQDHLLQLVDGLLRSPGRADLGFDFGERLLTGLRLVPERDADSFDGWTIPELEIRVPE